MTTRNGRYERRSRLPRDILVNVQDLKMYFPVTAGLIFQRKIADVKAVDDICFDVKKGETLGLVGESGCGKSTTGRAILQLYKPTAGTVNFGGTELTEAQAAATCAACAARCR